MKHGRHLPRPIQSIRKSKVLCEKHYCYFVALKFSRVDFQKVFLTIFHITAAIELFDVIIKSSLQMNKFQVDPIPDLSELTMCTWLRLPVELNENLYLTAHAVESDEMTADSFFLGLNGNKKLVFGIGTGEKTWYVQFQVRVPPQTNQRKQIKKR